MREKTADRPHRITILLALGAVCATLLGLAVNLWTKRPASPTPNFVGAGSSATRSRESRLGPLVDTTTAVNSAALAFGTEIAARGLVEPGEKEQLKGVIKGLVTIEYANEPLPSLLRNYVAGRREWNDVKSALSASLQPVSELVALIEQFNGDLVYKDLPTYKELRRTVNSRSELNRELENLRPPLSDQEKQQLLKIADNFEALSAQMKSLQTKLSKYLQE